MQIERLVRAIGAGCETEAKWSWIVGCGGRQRAFQRVPQYNDKL